mmetsp:Transcript_98713/g.226818  ORF Transcript_98713/g.226818 Transcript_98713/m.226818 type:complete len:423 (-) Transcript_98713:219-1487(-)
MADSDSREFFRSDETTLETLPFLSASDVKDHLDLASALWRQGGTVDVPLPLLPSDEVIKRWLLPGIVYGGTIRIPFDSSSKAPDEDAASHKYLLRIWDFCDGGVYAAHSAYSDEQVVKVEVGSESQGRVALSWSDQETRCQGFLDLSTGVIEGDVYQLAAPLDESFRTSRDASHCFSLRPIIPKEEWSERLQLFTVYASLLNRVDRNGFAESLGDALEKCGTEEKAALRADLLDIAQLRCGKVTHELAELAASVTGLVFNTQLDKEIWLQKINSEDNPDTRSRVCSRYGEANSLISQLQQIGKPGIPEMLALQSARATRDLRARLCLYRFGTALQQAEARPTRELIRSRITYVRDLPSSRQHDDCCVCRVSLVEEGSTELALLECGHSFHFECAQSWFDQANSCPLCRQPLRPLSPPSPDGQ